jgi:hypothetical protein
MSYNTNRATITVGDTTYDVETHDTNYGERYTISLDGEDVFEGLEGLCENEQYIEDHDNPRDWSSVGTMAVKYRGYNLGGGDDEDISEIDFEVECSECEGTGEKPLNQFNPIEQSPPMAMPDPEICDKCNGIGSVEINPVDYFKQQEGARVVLPLCVYEHSGITMYVGAKGDYPFDSQGWDTSVVGFIYDTPKQVKGCMGDNVTDEQIEEALRGEVKIYASYLEGDVTWFRVEDEETDFDESCGGFLGCREDCQAECYDALERAIARRLAENAERTYWLEREVMTI